MPCVISVLINSDQVKKQLLCEFFVVSVNYRSNRRLFVPNRPAFQIYYSAKQLTFPVPREVFRSAIDLAVASKLTYLLAILLLFDDRLTASSGFQDACPLFGRPRQFILVTFPCQSYAFIFTSVPIFVVIYI
jgi:hypothetical protein